MARNISAASRSRTAGMSDLALSMALPHERKPIRFPVVPATMTSVISTMGDGLCFTSDLGKTNAVLCRSPTYPLWVSRSFSSTSVYMQSSTAVGGAVGTTVFNSFDAETLTSAGTPLVDSVSHTNAAIVDNFAVLTDYGSTNALYIPFGSTMSILINSGAAASGEIDVTLAYFSKGEWLSQTVRLVAGTASYANYFVFQGIPGAAPTVGSIVDGATGVVGGFVALITGVVSTTTNSFTGRPILFGWAHAGYLNNPSGAATSLLVPFSPAVEFKNSTVPYTRCRANATAALFTNVTAALAKEGTILAGRLNSGTYNFYDVTEANINTAPPTQRYFGPLEKGLYTFSSPSLSDNLSDGWLTQANSGTRNTTAFPRFDPDVGMFHAMIFSDLGAASTGTQIATSVYTHIEFEPTTSLFQLGVSMQTLEALHAAEIALLKFGHFHENPIHWAAIAAAARAAIKTVAPMIAPYVAPAAEKLFRKGVSYLTGNPSGDRAMKQDLTPKPTKQPRKKQAKVKRPK